MVLYHGSKNKFDKFDYNTIGNNAGTDEGYGFYFTDDKETAMRYVPEGGYLYTVNVPRNRKLSNTKKTITHERLRKLLRTLHKEIDILNDFNDVEYYGLERVLNEAEIMLFENSNDVDIICELCNISGDKETVLRTACKVLLVGSIAVTGNKFEKTDGTSLHVVIDADLIEILNIEEF